MLFRSYFDPDNIVEATRVLRSCIEDEAGLAAWEQQIRRDFRPIPGEVTAEAVLDALLAEPAAPGVAQTASL